VIPSIKASQRFKGVSFFFFSFFSLLFLFFFQRSGTPGKPALGRIISTSEVVSLQNPGGVYGNQRLREVQRAKEGHESTDWVFSLVVIQS
jgi:hypothetical protein